MITPALTLYGTSQEVLHQAYADAYAATLEAIDLLRRTAPNERDYLGFISWQAAILEHEDRMRRLNSVRDELLALCGALDK